MLWYDRSADEWISVWKAGWREIKLWPRLIFTKFARPFRRLRLWKYRKQKLKEELDNDRLYSIEFNLVIDDAIIGPLLIEVPAKRMYMAKHKLQSFVKESVQVEIMNFTNLNAKNEKKITDRNRP